MMANLMLIALVLLIPFFAHNSGSETDQVTSISLS
jgi:hypothetical protein